MASLVYGSDDFKGMPETPMTDGDNCVPVPSLRTCDAFGLHQKAPVFPYHVFNQTHAGLMYVPLSALPWGASQAPSPTASLIRFMTLIHQRSVDRRAEMTDQKAKRLVLLTLRANTNVSLVLSLSLFFLHSLPQV